MILQKDDITLRQLKPQDAEELAKLANNKKIWNNVRDFFPSPYSIDNAYEFIDFCSKEKPVITFAIEWDKKLTGVVGLVPQQDIHRLSAEIGYWIGEPYWNKGIATKAVKIITRYALKELKLVRLFAGIFPFNLSSMKVLEKAEFTKEAVHSKAIIKNGEIYDEILYVYLK